MQTHWRETFELISRRVGLLSGIDLEIEDDFVEEKFGMANYELFYSVMLEMDNFHCDALIEGTMTEGRKEPRRKWNASSDSTWEQSPCSDIISS